MTRDDCGVLVWLRDLWRVELCMVYLSGNKVALACKWMELGIEVVESIQLGKSNCVAVFT